MATCYAVVHNSADLCGAMKPPCTHLVEYSATGTQLADIGAGEIGKMGFMERSSMVAVNDASGRVYVTDSGRGIVWIFEPPRRACGWQGAEPPKSAPPKRSSERS